MAVRAAICACQSGRLELVHEEFEDANLFGGDAFLKMTCLLQNSQFDRFSSQNVNRDWTIIFPPWLFGSLVGPTLLDERLPTGKST